MLRRCCGDQCQVPRIRRRHGGMDQGLMRDAEQLVHQHVMLHSQGLGEWICASCGQARGSPQKQTPAAVCTVCNFAVCIPCSARAENLVSASGPCAMCI